VAAIAAELTDDRGGGNLPRGAPGTDIGLHLQTVGAEIGVTYDGVLRPR
jgi:hypothetical protein